MSDPELQKCFFDSPLGVIELIYSSNGLRSLQFTGKTNGVSCNDEFAVQVKGQLNEYFEGKRFAFEVPLDLEGTDFQKKVWNELLRVPYGKTVSYSYIAKQLKNPLAVRAVGKANGSNKVSIIIPCHRIIGMDGSIVGYSGGTDRKLWLLDLEKKISEPKLFNS